MMVKKRKNGTKAAQWISEEPWRSFLGGVWLEPKIGDSLHMGYHTHPNSINSQNPRGMPWDPRLAAPYPNRKGIVLEPLQRVDNLELMLHHRPKTLHDKGLNTWQSHCSASMVIWGIGESKGCFQVATEGGVSQAEASQSIASQKFGKSCDHHEKTTVPNEGLWSLFCFNLQLFGHNQHDPHNSCEQNAISLLHLQDPFIPQKGGNKKKVRKLWWRKSRKNCRTVTVNTSQIPRFCWWKSFSWVSYHPGEASHFVATFFQTENCLTLLCTQCPHGADAH